MSEVTLKSLAEAGVENPVATFEAVALAGGFGAVKASGERALDVGGIADPAAKKAVQEIIAAAVKVKAVTNDKPAK